MEYRDCILLIKEPCRCTITAMDRYATIYDKHISKRSTKSNVCPKSENYEIMLCLLRSFMTAASSLLATKYVSCQFKDSSYSNGKLSIRKYYNNELLKGIVISCNIANATNNIPMKPIWLCILVNRDDIGSFVIEDSKTNTNK